MKYLDLGTLTGPVLAFGGPYSNLHATQALIGAARALNIAPSNCICTGDVVAYAGDPHDTAQAIRDFGCPVVAGNMEQQLGAGAADCGCGFDAGTACDLMAGAWFAHASTHVTADQRAWMAMCPDLVSFVHHGKRVAVLHGAASDVAKFLWPDTSEVVLQAEWALIEAQIGRIDMVISGHSGVPFIRALDKGTWLNAGVIGMPPHDGTPHTVFATLTEDGPTLHRLEYDHDSACTAMETAGLTQGYHRALVTGYWPSEDVLPFSLTLAARANG